MEEVKRIFKPEFLNRIDEIIVFHQLYSGAHERDCGYHAEEYLQDGL